LQRALDYSSYTVTSGLILWVLALVAYYCDLLEPDLSPYERVSTVLLAILDHFV